MRARGTLAAWSVVQASTSSALLYSKPHVAREELRSHPRLLVRRANHTSRQECDLGLLCSYVDLNWRVHSTNLSAPFLAGIVFVRDSV